MSKRFDPTSTQDLNAFGGMFWLDSIQLLRAGERLHEAARQEMRDTVIADVDQLVVETNLDCGCSREAQAILTMPTGGSVSAETAMRAVWAGYMASLKATMDAGRNERAHIGDDPAIMDMVASEITALGASTTPCHEVYGSGGTYLEALDCRYDAATRTLIVNPSIGS